MVFLYRIEWTAPKMIYAGIGLLWGFTAEIHNAVLGLFILILIDTITGFIAAPYRKQKRSSSRLRQFVPKIIPCATIFLNGIWQPQDHANIIETVKNISTLHGKNIHAICITQNSYDVFMQYLEA